MIKSLLRCAALSLTLGASAAFPAPPETHAAALAALLHPAAERRAEALAWLAQHGRMEDTDELAKRLHDASPIVRGVAEQSLWLLWSRSGDAEVDRILARGVGEMHSGQYAAAAATFSEVIRRRPDFAEGWNKRATAHFLAGEYRKSLADCDEVLERNPHHFGALSGYGLIYFQLEEYARAIAWWRRSLEVNPNMPGVELNIEHAERLLRDQRGRST